MRTRLLLFIVAMAAGTAMALDHYDPIALNAAAVQALRAGDLRAAEILLGRASRLAPNDARIARTKRALEAKRAGEPVNLDGLAAPAIAASRSETPAPATLPSTIPASPPPLWPPK